MGPRPPQGAAGREGPSSGVSPWGATNSPMIPLDEAQDAAHVVDQLLRTRSHVRVVRVLVTVDPSVNVTVRGLARLAGISHVQAGRIIAELERAGLATVRRHDGYSMVELNERHLLAPALSTLFDEELSLLEKVHGYAIHKARRGGIVLKVDLRPGANGGWVVRLISRQPFDWGQERWAAELEEELRRTTGLEIVVQVRTAQDVASNRLLEYLDAHS